jgi:hypothetical protein
MGTTVPSSASTKDSCSLNQQCVGRRLHLVCSLAANCAQRPSQRHTVCLLIIFTLSIRVGCAMCERARQIRLYDGDNRTEHDNGVRSAPISSFYPPLLPHHMSRKDNVPVSHKIYGFPTRATRWRRSSCSHHHDALLTPTTRSILLLAETPTVCVGDVLSAFLPHLVNRSRFS